MIEKKTWTEDLIDNRPLQYGRGFDSLLKTQRRGFLARFHEYFRGTKYIRGGSVK